MVIGYRVAEIWRFVNFQIGDHPPSWFVKHPKFWQLIGYRR